MGLGLRTTRFVGICCSLLGLACSGGNGTLAVDAEWNLTCPVGSPVGCGSIGDTCLGQVGQRAIVGSRGEMSCTGEPIVATCEGVDRSDGSTFVSLKASVGDAYAFELDAILGNGTVDDLCNVTIIEDEAMYDFGACGTDPPSMEQPCQLTGVSTANGEVVFGLECEGLVSTTSGLGFDVSAVGGGPATIRFANCRGF